jgi:MFS family permease
MSSSQPSAPGASRDPDLPLVLATGSSHLLTHAWLLVYPALLVPVQREFGLGLLTLGWIANAHYLASGAGALPAGWVADRLGAIPTLRIFLLGSAAALVLLGVSPSPLLLAASLMLLGALCSLYHPAGLALVSLRAHRMERALVLHAVVGNLGIAGTPFVAAALAELAGWRATCFAFALPGLLLGLLLPRRLGVSDPTRLLPPPDSVVDGADANASIRWRPLLFLYLTVTLTGFVYSGVTTFLPARLAASHPGALSRAGAVTSLALLVGVLGQLAGGLAWRRLSPIGLLVALLALSTPCLALVGHGSARVAAVAAAGFALFHFAAQPLSNGCLARWVPARRRSLGYGVYFTLSFGIGSFAASASGFVAEHWGLPRVFPFLAVASAAATLASMGMATGRLLPPYRGGLRL